MARPFTDGHWFTDLVPAGRRAGWVDPWLDLLDSDLYRALRAADKGLVAMVEFQSLNHTTGEVRTWYGASESFTTGASDNPAHTYIPGRVGRDFEVAREIGFDGHGKLRGVIETRISEISLINSDGAYDGLANEWVAEGRPLRVRLGLAHDVGGRREVYLRDFMLVYEGILGSIEVGHDVMTLRVDDKRRRLLAPAQQDTYRGIGDEHGDAELTGVRKPLAIGAAALHVPAVLINPTALIHQVSSYPVASIEVFDRGVPVPIEATYSDYNSLRIAPVTPGMALAAPSIGMFKLGSMVGPVTATVTHTTVVPQQLGRMSKWILLNLGGFSPGELDGSFDNWTSGRPLSYWLGPGQDISLIQLLEELCAGFGAAVGAGRDGRYRLVRIDPPTASPVLHIASGEIQRIERLPLPYGVPPHRFGVTYAKTWRPHTETEIAGSVPAQTRTLLANEWRTSRSPEHPDIIALYPNSYAFPDITAHFIDSSSAASEVTRLRQLYAPGRALYRLAVKTALFILEIGQTVRVEYPRWDLHGGRDLVILGIRDDFGAVETELLLFGGDAIALPEPPAEPEPLPAPVATDDFFEPIVQGAGSVEFDVLENDVWQGTPTIAIVMQTGPGTATVTGSGRASRISVPRGTIGVKSVLYELAASLNSFSNKAVMQVEITGEMPAAPEAVDDDFGEVGQNSGIWQFNVLSNDTFLGTPTISIVSYGTSNPVVPTVVGTGSASRIQVSTTNAGLVELQYRLASTENHGDAYANMQVRIVASAVAPQAVNDSFPPVQAVAGQSIDFNVLLNDVYAGTPTITIVSQTGPGTATITGTGAASRIRVPIDTAGTKTVTYRLSASLNQGSSDATMTVVIQAAPVETTYVADGYVDTGYVV